MGKMVNTCKVGWINNQVEVVGKRRIRLVQSREVKKGKEIRVGLCIIPAVDRYQVISPTRYPIDSRDLRATKVPYSGVLVSQIYRKICLWQ